MDKGITLNKNTFQIGIYRWEIMSIILILLISLLLWYVLYPVVKYQTQGSMKISRRLNFLKTESSLPAKNEEITNKVKFLDSLIQLSQNREIFNEPVVLEKIYSFADSAQCAIEKVQIDEPLEIGDGIEIPVLVKGTGKYKGIGKFIDKIENSNYAIRIRQLTMQNIKRGKVEIFLDFVIMENNIGKVE